MDALELNDSTLTTLSKVKTTALSVAYSPDSGETNPLSIETLFKCGKGGGTCSTAGATAAKTVTIETLGGLIPYVTTVLVKFTNANTADSMTLNVTYNGGSSGALPCYAINTASEQLGSGSIPAGAVMEFTYGDDCWLAHYKKVVDTVASGNSNAVSSNAVNGALADYGKLKTVTNPTTSNLNSFTENGYYSIGNTANYSNLPLAKAGSLLVYNAGVYRIQRYIVNETTVEYIRRSSDNGSSWGDWSKLATTSDLDDLGGTMNVIDSSYIASTDTIICGGYWVIGKLVIVNFRFSTTSTKVHDMLSIGGLPSCVSLSKNYISCNIQPISKDDYEVCYGVIPANGRCCIKVPDTSYEYSLSAVYIKA